MKPRFPASLLRSTALAASLTLTLGLSALAETDTAAKPAADHAREKSAAKPAKKTKGAKKAAPRKKTGDKGERHNKKAEVIAMMKRAKGATLAQIMETTGWQKHTIRGFVSLGAGANVSVETLLMAASVGG